MQIFFTDDFKISIANLTGDKAKKKVMEMIKKLAQGWRLPASEKVVSSELLEHYNIDAGQLYLVWSIDIMKEASTCSQVIQVWDISPASELPKLAKKLMALFGRYTMDDLNLCKHKALEGYAFDAFLIAVYEVEYKGTFESLFSTVCVGTWLYPCHGLLNLLLGFQYLKPILQSVWQCS